MATIHKQKIGTTASIPKGATTTFQWNNYPEQTAVSYFVVPVPPAASGEHGTRQGVVEIKRIVVTYKRDNHNGDSRNVKIDIKNVGSTATAADVWQSWIT